MRITACLCVYYEGLNSEQNRASCDRPRFVLCGEKFQILNQTKYKVKAKRDLIRIAYTVVTAKISSGAATDVHAVVHGKYTQYTYIYIKYYTGMEYIVCRYGSDRNHFVDYLQTKILDVYFQFLVIIIYS